MVKSNDPVTPQVTLQLKVELDVALDLEPAHLDFGTIPVGRGATRTVKLIGPDAAQTKILSASVEVPRTARAQTPSPSPVVLAHNGEGDAAGSVELSVVPEAPEGTFFAQLKVRTDHPLVPELMLRVQGLVGAKRIRQPVPAATSSP